MQDLVSFINLSNEGQSVVDPEPIGTLSIILGSLGMMIAAGLNSLAGLGGGAPQLALLISVFGLLPKDATIVVFSCIVGTSCGNTINQMRRALDGDPVINYGYAAIAIPVVFMGTLLGVFLNRFLPSIGVVLIVIAVAAYSLPKIFKRFVEGYHKETEELIEHHEQNRNSGVIKESIISPFQNELNRKVFQKLLVLVATFIVMSLLRGSEKFPSIIGVPSCSILYWSFTLAMFGLALYFFRSNMHLLKVWKAPNLTLGQQLFEHDDTIQRNEGLLIKNSIGAGIFSGFGLGGGVFLIPMFRMLGLNAVQASSTGAFAVFIAAILNVIQALLLGVLSIKQFLFFFSVTCFGSFCISLVVGTYLRKIHRTSIVELLLFLLLLASALYLPVSLFLKVREYDYNWSLILSFGPLC